MTKRSDRVARAARVLALAKTLERDPEAFELWVRLAERLAGISQGRDRKKR